MSALPDSLLQQLHLHSHYRNVDYDALVTRVGPEIAERRLRRQLAIYQRHAHPHVPPLRRRVRPLFRAALRAGLWLSGQLEASRRLARSPDLVHREIRLARLPRAFDGFRILHLSDFHFEFTPDIPECLPGWLRGLEFDLCVLTGDYRGETFGPYEESLQALERCRSLLGPDVYAVLGNHDNLEMLLEFPRMGIRGLLNEAVWLERGGEKILLAGIDDAHYYRTHRFDSWAGLLSEAPFCLLLSHTPEAYAEAAFAGIDLMLSGHTHGGQICLPGGIHVLAHLHNTPRTLVRGPWVWQGLQGYTSRGIGASTIDSRCFCPPEITLHTLRFSGGSP